MHRATANLQRASPPVLAGRPKPVLRSEDLARDIALLLMSCRVGARLPTLRTIAKSTGASLGAVQGVIARLDQAGTIEVERHGRHGAVLVGRSVSGLWAAGVGEPLIAALPLPSTAHCSGLATAIKALLAGAGIPVFLIFVRGSRQRLTELRQGRCHLAVMSSLAARETGPQEVVALELPDRSYVNEHRVYYVQRPGRLGAPARVLMDRDSADFQYIAELEFGGSSAQFVPANYMQFARLLKADEADVAIWDSEEAVGGALDLSVQHRSLSRQSLEQLAGANTRAAFIVRRDDVPAQEVVRECLPVDRLLRVQSEVVAEERVPEY